MSESATLTPAQKRAATIARKRAEAETAAAEQLAEQLAEQVDLAAIAAGETIEKVTRIYVDDPRVPRVPTPDGTLATVQREKRADGSLGEYMLAEVRINQKDKSESVQRYPVLRVQSLIDTLAGAGVKVIR